MNVLTIDLDFVMKDMIEIQSKIQIDTEYPIERYWAGVRAVLGVSKISAHEGAIEWLRELVASTCTYADKHVISTHDEIIEVLRECNDNNISLVNVDYHHDIDYDGAYAMSEENWVLHAHRLKLFSTYAWVTHGDARSCTSVPLYHEVHVWTDKKIEDFPQFDVLVVCISPRFTAPEFWPLAKELTK